MGLKPRTKSRSNQLKTRPTSASVEQFVDAIVNDRRRQDSKTVLAMMRDITGEQPVMWGSGIVGFGSYHYKNASGREGDWPRTGLSPRKQALTVYCMLGFAGAGDLLGKLGRHTTGVSCLYLPRLDQVDLAVLRTLISRSYADMAAKYPQ